MDEPVTIQFTKMSTSKLRPLIVPPEDYEIVDDDGDEVEDDDVLFENIL
jgi:hypothetical protein